MDRQRQPLVLQHLAGLRADALRHVPGAQEAGNSGKPFKSNETFDKYRYLPQKETFFNPDALPVGFTKTTYKGKDYVGYTCAACHTGQINFKRPAKAIRIDGGPAMADMVEFLTALQKALEDTGENEEQKTSPRQRRARPNRTNTEATRRSSQDLDEMDEQRSGATTSSTTAKSITATRGSMRSAGFTTASLSTRSARISSRNCCSWSWSSGQRESPA